MDIERYSHEHHFNQHKPKTGEKRTWWVILLTTITMVGEIITGLLFGSMALLADGLHMASHTTALMISALAYRYARKHAHDKRFSFGTGKVGSLAGFISAFLLAFFALIMVIESIQRIMNPVFIAFDEAIFVATIGLIVNILSVIILRVKDHTHNNDSHSNHHDHNLRAAYLHVLADTLTSLLAIFALVAGKFFGFGWMDPLMGIVGAVMVTRWAIGLLKQTSRILLDFQAPEALVQQIKESLEQDNHSKITDLHVWSIGSNQFAAIIELLCDTNKDEKYFRKQMENLENIIHVTIAMRRDNK